MLAFIKGRRQIQREEGTNALIAELDADGLKYKRFNNIIELQKEVRAALVKLLRQMHFYLNYAREHWTNADENLPVGVILCAEKNAAVVRYALDGLANKVMAAEYLTVLPKEDALAAELNEVQRKLGRR